jgi:hypothetical protein
VVSLQCGLGVTASQTPVSVAFAERPELLGGEAARAGMLRRSPLAAVVGLGLPDLLGVFLAPLLAAGDYLVSVKLVVLTLGSAYASFLFFCPLFLVLGYLFLMFFLVLSARLDSLRMICSGLVILGILLQMFAPVFLCALTQALHFFPQRPS